MTKNNFDCFSLRHGALPMDIVFSYVYVYLCSFYAV